MFELAVPDTADLGALSAAALVDAVGELARGERALCARKLVEGTTHSESGCCTAARPAFVFGAGILPTPLLGAILDRARIRDVHHPGPESAPEPRYTPSRALAEFVRCRDLTCRFPRLRHTRVVFRCRATNGEKVVREKYPLVVQNILGSADTANALKPRINRHRLLSPRRFAGRKAPRLQRFPRTWARLAGREMSAYKTLVVGTDGSDTSLRAVDHAASVAAESDAKLIIAMAHLPNVDKGGWGRPARPDRVIDADGEIALGGEGDYKVHGEAPVYEILREARDRAKAAGANNIETRSILGDPVHALSRLAKEVEADLLVVGNVGLATRSGKWLGSVPGNVLARAKRTADVLIVHTTD